MYHCQFCVCAIGMNKEMVVEAGFEPTKLTQQIYSLPPLTAREFHQMVKYTRGFINFDKLALSKLIKKREYYDIYFFDMYLKLHFL